MYNVHVHVYMYVYMRIVHVHTDLLMHIHVHVYTVTHVHCMDPIYRVLVHLLIRLSWICSQPAELPWWLSGLKCWPMKARYRGLKSQFSFFSRYM